MGAQLALPLEKARPRGEPMARNSAFHAGAKTARTLKWHAPTVSPNSAVLPNLTTLRDRSRLAVRNDGFAYGVIDKLVTNIVGKGIKPQSKAADTIFRRAIQALWTRWTAQSDADGLLGWYGQERQAVWSWLEAGEVFLRLRPRRPSDGLIVPLQIQVIEAELCPHAENRILPSGNKVRAGIEFDRIGRRVAYWFYALRPGDPNEWDTNDLRRVPAESVIHLFDPQRPGQIRGVPHLTRALIRLHELDKYDDATLLRQQIGNLFALYVKQPAGDPSLKLNPVTGLEADDTRGERDVVTLEPGLSQELAPGEEVTFSDPPDPPASYPSFMKQQLMSVSAATGVPYEVLTGDMAGLNDRVMRVILHEFRRGIQTRQHHIVAYQVCRPVWAAWMTRVFLSGALPIPVDFADDPEPWSAVNWHAQGWPYIHPVQDVDSAKKAVNGGFTSRARVVSEQGEDAEVIDEEQAADNERAADLGLAYETSTGGAPSPEPEPPDPVADPEADPDPEPAPAPEPEGATA